MPTPAKPAAAVLMINDEPAQRESLRQALENSGYQILERFADAQGSFAGGAFSKILSSRSESSPSSRAVTLLVIADAANSSAAAGKNSPTDDRSPGRRKKHLAWGPITMDFDDQKATIGGQPVRLTVTEFSLLRLLAERAGKLVRHREFLLKIWGRDDPETRACLRAYAWMLRKKLRHLFSHELLVTEPGVGYRLACPA